MATRVISGYDVPVSVVTNIDASGNAGVIVNGGVASGATDSGNPVKVGGVSTGSASTAGGAFTSGQRSNLFTDSAGNLKAAMYAAIVGGADGVANSSVAMVNGNDAAASTRGPLGVLAYNYNGSTLDRPRGNTTGSIVIPPQGWTYAAASGGIVNTTTAVTIKSAAGAGIRNYLTSLTIASDALGAATELAIRDGAGGTVIWRTKLQTAALVSTTIYFETPLYSTANTLLEVLTITATVTGGVFVNAQGYTAP